jgi:D-sedoheptulose 7-phosphate isomerase
MQEKIKQLFEDSIKVKEKIIETIVPDIEESAKIMIDCLKKGNKILICGNGGSAADAQHIAGELVCRFKKERPGLPCIALTTDTSIITAWLNDYTGSSVFARQVNALGNKGDILLGISTSANSPNIIKAYEEAKEKGIICLGLLGNKGGKIKDLGYVKSVIVPSSDTPRIQESHLVIYHIWCRLIEDMMFPND